MTAGRVILPWHSKAHEFFVGVQCIQHGFGRAGLVMHKYLRMHRSVAHTGRKYLSIQREIAAAMHNEKKAFGQCWPPLARFKSLFNPVRHNKKEAIDSLRQ